VKTTSFQKSNIMHTVILNFGNGNVQVFEDLTAHQAEQLVHVALFHNKGCDGVSVVKQDRPEDPRDYPDYPTE
jgi:hypothetical protein